MTLPQLRVITTSTAHETEGVALSTWVTIVASTLAAGVYGLSGHHYSIVPGAILAIVMAGVVSVALLRLRQQSLMPVIALWLGVLLMSGLTWTVPAVAGWTSTVFAVMQRQPQITSSLQTLREPGRESGVSLGAWWCSLLCNMLWLSYSIAAHDVIIGAANVVMLSQTSLIIGIEGSMRLRRTHSLPTGASQA